MRDRIDKSIEQRILHNLNLESSRSSAATGLLELASLGSDVRLDTIVCVGVVDRSLVAEMAHSLTGVLGTAEKNGVGTLGGAKGQLVKGDALTTSLDNAGSGISSEAKSADGQLGDLDHAGVVGDSTNNHSNLVLLSLHVSRQAGQRDGSLVQARRAKSLGNDTSKLRFGSSGQEGVKLHQKLQVYVLRSGSLADIVSNSSSASNKINTHIYPVMLLEISNCF
mmetsp:Transcript_25461/g.42920  ORF Transcript_25461/g.42920 Transcript_25461/m.42920 type:complete len:223 (-) Transcript_25461:9-677(-)